MDTHEDMYRSEFEKRVYEAGLRWHELGYAIAKQYRAGNPAQTKEEQERMYLELDYLEHPPYHIHFDRHLAEMLAYRAIYEIGPTLDRWFPTPDPIDIQYIEDLLLHIKSSARKHGFISTISVDEKFEENIERTRTWVEQKRSSSKPPAPAPFDSAAPRVAPAEANNINEAAQTVTFHNDFTEEHADIIAEEVGIIQGGRYALGVQKKSAVTGFIEGLKMAGVLSYATTSTAHAFFGRKYSVVVNTDRETNARVHYRKTTLKAAHEFMKGRGKSK